jgi:hypothetical protein
MNQSEGVSNICISVYIDVYLFPFVVLSFLLHV